MRTRHWLATLTSGCLALAGIGTVAAQQPSGNPDQMGMGMLPPPQAYGAYGVYGPVQPGSQAPYPPGANPWPGISPFDNNYNATAYKNGFWYNLMRSHGRSYYASVDAVFGHTINPREALIGAPGVNPLTLENRVGLLTAAQTATTTTTPGVAGATTTTTAGATAANTSLIPTQFNQSPPGNGPVRSIGSATGAGTAGASGTTGGATGTGTASSGPTIFPDYTTAILPSTLDSTGIKGTWGWFNDDDTGFVVSGYTQFQSKASWQLFDPNLILDPSDRNNNASLHLHAWFGLPLAGADTDGTSVGQVINDGAVVPYDMGVFVTFQTRLSSANTDWYFSPIYENGAVKIRPTAGGRYIRLQEAFTLDANDSGAGYTITSSSSSGGGTSGSTTGATGGTGATTGGYLTPSGAFQANFLPGQVQLIHSHLNSGTLSDMAGPEAGFRIDLGSGKKFQMWTVTKAAALANVSQRNINGYGIGNSFNIISPNTVPALPKDTNLTQFNNNYFSTTFSPMFEQSINVKFPVFNLIPYINRLEMFERAELTGGWTFLWIGNTYRPNNDIVWNQTVVTTSTNPTTGQTTSQVGTTPTVNNTRTDFYNNMFNVGIQWTY